MSSSQEPAGKPGPQNAKPTDSTRCFEFEDLSQGENELQITFMGMVYRLRKTRNDRLILTK